MAFSVPTSSFNWNTSFSASEKIKASKYFISGAASEATLWEKASNLSFPIDQAFSPDVPDILGDLGYKKTFASSQLSWTFITAPEDISWDVQNQTNRVDIFGTNNPPVVAGSRGMRELTLSNSLVEGFVRKISLEGKIAALENLMNYGLNTSEGFVSVPVYQVWANNKSYGGSEAYFIIKSVNVKEEMRDLQGNATRAFVDVSFMQVPAYQVNSGRDQASRATSAAGQSLKQDVARQVNQNVPGKGSTTAAGSPSAKNASGSGSAKPKVNTYRGPRGLGEFDLGF